MQQSTISGPALDIAAMSPPPRKMPPTQAGDRQPMLTRMVSLVRSFAPIPGLDQPRPLTRVPCDGPHALGAIFPVVPTERMDSADAFRPGETRSRVRSAP